MKRKIIYLALCSIAFGCNHLEMDNVLQSHVGQFPDEYLAYVDSEAQTKVFVNNSLKTLWNADDRISIFNDTYNNQFKFNGETGADNGTFSKVQNDYYTAAETPTTYAVYPYNPSTSITEEGEITLTLPAIQNYAQNSYGLGANTMVAATETPTSNALYFKTLCSFVVIKLYGTGTVKSIILTGNNGEKLAGTATVKPVYGEAPSATMSDEAGSSITLDCGDGVVIGTTAETATEFWFCIPPTTFTNGFTIKAITNDGYCMEKETTGEKIFERNTKYTMATIEGVFDKYNNVLFEDAKFKNYCVQNFDEDGDGEISIEEAGNVDSIDLCDVVASLKGIEYFTQLRVLKYELKYSSMTIDDGAFHYYDELGNEIYGLTSLDLSKNTALKHLQCNSNQLTSLDLSNNTALTYLYCYNNQLTSLDVSKNTALTELNCDSNQLISLNLGKNTTLTSLWCNFNQLTSLDVSGCTALTFIDCYVNQLTSLDVSNNTALLHLWCGTNQLTSLDVSKNTALTQLSCDSNQLTSLDVSNNTALEGMGCDDNQLTSIDVSKNIALKSFSCGSNPISSLDLSKNTALTSLRCSFNQLSSLDLSWNTALTSLSCEFNQLTSLDVSKNVALVGICCIHNQLTSLDVSKNTALTSLSCYNNQISTIYVWEGFDPSKISIHKDDSASFVVKTDKVLFEDAKFKNYCVQNFDTNGDGEISIEEAEKVEKIECGNCGITSLKGIEFFISLSVLDCRDNQLTSLDISKNTALTSLTCSDNQISTIYVWEGFDPSKLSIIKDDSASFVVTLFEDANFKAYCVEHFDTDGDGGISIEEAEKVEEIECGNCGITSLKGIEFFISLSVLDCRDNQLTSLDVSKNTALTSLYCSENQLTSLDVSKNTALTYLYCDNNQLTSLDVSKNTALDVLLCYENQLTSLDVSKNTALTYLFCVKNQLTSLDVSKNTALTYLYCDDNQLTSLDVSKNTALTYLYCFDNQLTSLDVSKNTALTSLECSGNQLTSLDVSKNTALTWLGCDVNQLTSLDISKNTALTDLYCNYNQISTIYVWEGFDPSKIIILPDFNTGA